MAVNNNAKIIRREILARITEVIINGENLHELDRIALKMRPRKGDHVRCCVYHDRAVIKYKIMSMLGFSEDSNDDELKSLADYYKESQLEARTSAPILNVVDEACSSCQKNNYVVTNMCQGCVGRSCMLNCPKNAIIDIEGKAKIDKNLCVNCGICQQVCPFHAIIYAPVPCEDVCPVSAIQKGEDGKEFIDMEKCILCGKCMEACPYGAVVEKTHLFDVIRDIQNGDKVIAMCAPSIAGQFRNSMPKIISSLYDLGFTDAREVARGADITAEMEAIEFKEHIEENIPMTTSCCPSFVNMMNKYIPEHIDKVSSTKSPMEYTAAGLRKQFPDAKLVFIGPCVAKKGEAIGSEHVDFVLNFEELGAWLIATKIDIENSSESHIEDNISENGRLFAQAGNVGNAVSQYLSGFDFNSIQIDGIDRGFFKKIKPFLEEKKANLVEVMACEGGCIGGCSTINTPKAAGRLIKKFIDSEVCSHQAL